MLFVTIGFPPRVPGSIKLLSEAGVKAALVLRRRIGSLMFECHVCSNYQASTDLIRLQKYFGVDIENLPPFQAEVYPVRPAPLIRLVKDDSGSRGSISVCSGLPFFAKEKTYGRRTYNARTETVDRLPSFKHAWGRGQRCIIPAERIYEPNYECLPRQHRRLCAMSSGA